MIRDYHFEDAEIMNTKILTMCFELKEALEDHKNILFNCVGGCGIDTSLGKNPCMGAAGHWFKFCPFCGKKIVSSHKEGQWEWHEEQKC